ncbi:hypothetical protein VPMG_00030 [Vibrio phage VBP32]|uniref:Uncharacterized protein n=2 Tax=Stoningtonvirus VBP47 TaxID=2846606 RepID=M4SL99_9CAUD|nr:hypothetical protein VPNG_00098 [Vibrio phage VBP47]YP_007676520.1 hypothetical protein VPMG_00030 [Vibrio phage VBP32]AGH57122.1 hypothetical protein VPNG_00098 [Vibrio phage VBP47]AGH57169.1 hypothetical protein VPMG_00030 [Vibrio phage VBP32]
MTTEEVEEFRHHILLLDDDEFTKVFNVLLTKAYPPFSIGDPIAKAKAKIMIEISEMGNLIDGQ